MRDSILPTSVAAGLAAILEVSATSYYQYARFTPRLPLLAAVGEGVSAQCFSACGSVYARWDLSTTQGVGKADLMAALQSETVLESAADWGVAAASIDRLLSQNQLVFHVGAVAAQQFLAALPLSQGINSDLWVVSEGDALQISARLLDTGEFNNGVRFPGAQRLSVLKGLAAQAQGLRVYRSVVAGVAVVVVLELPSSEFSVVLSEQAWRKFPDFSNLVLEPAAENSDLAVGQLSAALLSISENPRLGAARKLYEGGRIRSLGKDWVVRDGISEYFIRLGAAADRLEQGANCNCIWFLSHAGERGPCKHILAAILQAESVK